MAQDPPSQYVTLISYDHFEFVIPRETAKRAGAIKRMIDPDNKFEEATTGRCTFENLSGRVLETVCEYLLYNEKFQHSKEVPDMDIPPELCLELLMAADYLEC